jgi:hypothetical protein
MVAVTEFNRVERPKYLRCAETLNSITNSPLNNAEFFAQRYKAGNPERGYFSKAAALLREISKRTNDVFSGS